MSKFEQAMQSASGWLIVKYERQDDGKDHFAWAMQGTMPFFGLLGTIAGHVQPALVVGPDTTHRVDVPAPERALFVTYDAKKQQFAWFVSEDIPHVDLCGFLELVKVLLLQKQSMGQPQRPVQVRTPLLGPDGQPYRG